MKIKDLKKLGLTEKEINNLEVSTESAIVHSEFNKDAGRRWIPGSADIDYRDAATARLIKSKTSFLSEKNIFGSVAKRVISLICPGCEKVLGGRSSGGSFAGPMSGMNFNAKCDQCNISVSLTMPGNGIGVTFHE